MSGYYFSKGAKSNYWIIQQQGGGWCWDEKECKKRISPLVIPSYMPHLAPISKKITLALKVSSKDWAITMKMDVGIWESSDHGLLNANKVVLCVTACPS